MSVENNSSAHLLPVEDNTLIQLMTCPITKNIFLCPVVLSDGHTYEYEYILKWFITNPNKISPLNNQKICSMNPNLIVKNLVESFLEKNPLKKCDQYVSTTTPLIDYMSCSTYFSNNVLPKIEWNCQEYNLLSTNTDRKNYIDQCNNLEYTNSEGWKPIHQVCRISDPEIIKYMIDKGVNLESALNTGWKPIHQICRFSTPQMIKYIIDKGVNLESVTDEGVQPIHLICQFSTSEMVKYIIDKGVNLECVTRDGLKPIHSICQRSMNDMIKYIIDKGVDLEQATTDGWKPIHLICRFSTPEMIAYIIDKGVDLNGRLKKYNVLDGSNYDIFELARLNETNRINCLNVLNDKCQKISWFWFYTRIVRK